MLMVCSVEKQCLVFGEKMQPKEWRTNSSHLLLQLLQTSRAVLLWKDLCVPVMLAVFFYIIFFDTLTNSGPSQQYSTQPVCQSHTVYSGWYHASSGVNEYNLMVLLLPASFIANNYVYVSNVQCQICTGWQRCMTAGVDCFKECDSILQANCFGFDINQNYN